MNQPKMNYGLFGGVAEEEEPQQPSLAPQKQIQAQPQQQATQNPVQQQPPKDYSQFGGQPEVPEKKKAGKWESAMYGLAEGVLGLQSLLTEKIPDLAMGALDKAAGITSEPPKKGKASSLLESFPESEDEPARRIRAGAQAFPFSAIGGIPGIIGGLVGSQAGQTVREIFGKEGKFDEFGWGEAGAIIADILTGGGSQVLSSLIGKKAPQVGAALADVFTRPQSAVRKASVKHIMQNEGELLNQVVDDFSRSQLSHFNNEASNISQNRYLDLTHSDASAIQQQTQNMHRNGLLGTISPLNVTQQEAGLAMQQAANHVFEQNVLTAERQAYGQARIQVGNTNVQLANTLDEAETLLAQMTRSGNPSPKQEPTIRWLRNLIDQLRVEVPPSQLLNARGQPLVPGGAQTATLPANQAIDLLQNTGHQVNYGSTERLQSHRLIPVVNTMRTELRNGIAATNPQGAQLLDSANRLHATNAETWGTNYMRKLRFSENPESIVQSTSTGSNMRNFKRGVNDPAIQGIADRAVVDKMTTKGSAKANRETLRQIEQDLGVNARSAAEQLISGKDPLTNTGGRMAIQNEILKDAAAAVNTGKRPEKILNLMETQKGYALVRDAMNSTPRARELFNSFERLFMEDFVSSITTDAGRIDFKKASNIFKNEETRRVLERIGGPQLVSRFEDLQTAARNFEVNASLYNMPETKNIITEALKSSGNAAVTAGVLHTIGMPTPLVIAAGTVKGAATVAKATYKTLKSNLLANPKAVHYLELLSQAASPKEVSKQLPRLINALGIKSESDTE